MVFIALLFYTLETLLIFGIVYLLSIPISIIIYSNQNKKLEKYLMKIMKIFYNEKIKKKSKK